MLFRRQNRSLCKFENGRALFRSEKPIEEIQAECARQDGMIELSENGKWHCIEDGKVYRLASINEILGSH